MGPWSFVAPRFEKQLACKVSRASVSNIVLELVVGITLTETFLLSASAPAGQPTCAPRPSCRNRDPPSATTRGHPHRYLCLVL